MAQPHSLQSLTGKSAPTFEQPFDMMQACHQRLDRTLDLLAKLRAHLPGHGADEQARQAARDVMRYFDQAAPNHHTDEEAHVFPVLLAQGDPAVSAAVLRLQEEHEMMARGWDEVRGVLTRIAEGRTDRLSAGEEAVIEGFSQLYATHIRLEETLAYPAALKLLDETQLREMGREMQARRGGQK